MSSRKDTWGPESDFFVIEGQLFDFVSIVFWAQEVPIRFVCLLARFQVTLSLVFNSKQDAWGSQSKDSV